MAEGDDGPRHWGGRMQMVRAAHSMYNAQRKERRWIHALIWDQKHVTGGSGWGGVTGEGVTIQQWRRRARRRLPDSRNDPVDFFIFFLFADWQNVSISYGCKLSIDLGAAIFLFFSGDSEFYIKTGYYNQKLILTGQCRRHPNDYFNFKMWLER